MNLKKKNVLKINKRKFSVNFEKMKKNGRKGKKKNQFKK